MQDEIKIKCFVCSREVEQSECLPTSEYDLEKEGDGFICPECQSGMIIANMPDCHKCGASPDWVRNHDESAFYVMCCRPFCEMNGIDESNFKSTHGKAEQDWRRRNREPYKEFEGKT